MPRPPALPADKSADNIVDADVCARAGTTIARHFSAVELPRLREAGGREGSAIEATFQFSQYEDRPAVMGTLAGVVVLTCQRCMQPVSIDLDDSFQVLLVDEERSDEPGGFEPVVADSSRLDLCWLAEEQALLALPLVPMHDSQCAEVKLVSEQPVTAVGGKASEQTDEDEVKQQPFANLRDLLRKQ